MHVGAVPHLGLHAWLPEHWSEEAMSKRWEMSQFFIWQYRTLSLGHQTGHCNNFDANFWLEILITCSTLSNTKLNTWHSSIILCLPPTEIALLLKKVCGVNVKKLTNLECIFLMILLSYIWQQILQFNTRIFACNFPFLCNGTLYPISYTCLDEIRENQYIYYKGSKAACKDCRKKTSKLFIITFANSLDLVERGSGK